MSMKIRIKHFVLTAAAALALSACDYAPTANAPANNANASNANANAAKPVAAAPTKEALFALEKQAWEAWKNRDTKFFETSLSPNYVGFAPTGRVDKAGSIKSMADSKCEVKSYSWSDEQMHMLGADVAVLTYKAAQDFICDGKKGPENVWSAGVYAREGDTWKNVFYAETPVTDPNAPPSKAAPASAAKPADTAKPDALTETLMAVETKGWDAWKNRDAKAMEGVMATSAFTYFSGAGRKPKPEALKTWSEPKCEGLAYAFSEPAAVQFSKDVALVTYKADVKGTCDGKQTPPSLWVASFNLKEGDNWKNAFYMDWSR
jgi:hypothetical protein